LSTPDPDNTPDAVCDAAPDVEAPSLEAVGPTDVAYFILGTLLEAFILESRLPFSLPCLETSARNSKSN
jgi:hypothetical protein